MASNEEIKEKYTKRMISMEHEKISSSKSAVEPTMIRVEDNIYIAANYGLAHSIMIVGDTGVVIIDTMENVKNARNVKAAFRKITSKPIVGIVFTHFHGDHAFGTESFLEDEPDNGKHVEIFSHDSFSYYFSQVMNVTSQIHFNRAARQFGIEIPDVVKEKSGFNLNLKFGEAPTSYIFPTKTFSKELDISIGGLELQLLHAPGETNDQIVVWYKQKKILFAADNIYQAFPNLYAIRGCMHRDTLQWVKALDLMIRLKPEIMVPQHTSVIYGRENVKSILTAYRDAIQFVHDQTVRYMNKGYTAQEIVELVKLPEHLNKHPYLKEYYGTVEWSIKAVYHGYLGWFSGRAADLHPLPKREESRLYLDLIGSTDRVLTKAEEALKENKHQWAMQLADLILDAANQSQQDIDRAKEVKSEALHVLAFREISSGGMNWYLTEELVSRGLQIKPPKGGLAERVKQCSIQSLFNMLSVMLDVTASEDAVLSTLFNFTDTGVQILVQIRRGVCVIIEDAEDIADCKPDGVLCTTEDIWRQIFAKVKDVPTAIATGVLKVEPNAMHLVNFFSFFELN